MWRYKLLKTDFQRRFVTFLGNYVEKSGHFSFQH